MRAGEMVFAMMPRAPAPDARVFDTDWILFPDTVMFDTRLPR